MEQEILPVRVVVRVMEQQSPHTAINFETERALESNLTILELLTSVIDVITKSTKVVDCPKQNDW